MRLIDADALIEKCGGWYVEEGTEEGFIGTVKQLLEGLPSAQPATNCSEIPNSSDDTISRQAALDAFGLSEKTRKYGGDHSGYDTRMLYEIQDTLENLPAVQTERTEHIPETKAVRSKRDCVDLSELVSATFYDQEHEEWTQQIVTIADVLDSVCDEYTILPSVQPEPHWIPCTERMPHNTGDFYLCTAKLSVDDEYEVELLMLDTANDFDKSYFSKCIHNGLVFRESWSGGNEALDVIAWMPLPEPYHEEVTK